MKESTISSLFESHGLDTIGLNCASMILGTLINQRFTNTAAFKTVDQEYFRQLVPVVAEAAYSLANAWTKSGISQGGQATVERPRFAVGQ